MSTSSIPVRNPAETVASTELVGNPRRVRGLDRSLLQRPAPVSTLVGNPRRLRKLDAAAFAA